MARRKWTNEDVLREMHEASEQLGRMPSATELRAMGKNALAVKASRMGLWKVAGDIGLAVKESDSLFGIGVQEREAGLLRAEGLAVESHPVKHPFDLTVGTARVDVKASHYAEYQHKDGGSMSRGYFFALHKLPATCDLYLLVCVGGMFDGDRYFVPANEAPQRMATITPTGRRFAPYRNAVHILRGMAA